MSNKIRIPNLKVEENNEIESWNKFLKRFEIAAISVDFSDKVTEADAEKKVKEVSKRKGAALLNNLGEDGMDIFDTFDISVVDIQFDNIVEKFTNYFSRRENKTILRHRFLNMKQGTGEALSEFIQRVLKQSHSCQLAGLREDLAIHIMINGMEDEKLKTDLLQISDINLGKLTSACAQHESAGRTMEELKSKRRVEEIGGASSNQCTCTQSQPTNEPQGAAAAINNSGCHNCGSHEHYLRNCPTVPCYNCNKQGHISRDCSEPKKGAFRGGNRGARGTYRGRGGFRGRGRGYTGGQYQAAAYQGENNIEERIEHAIDFYNSQTYSSDESL